MSRLLPLRRSRRLRGDDDEALQEGIALAILASLEQVSSTGFDYTNMLALIKSFVPASLFFSLHTYDGRGALFCKDRALAQECTRHLARWLNCFMRVCATNASPFVTSPSGSIWFVRHISVALIPAGATPHHYHKWYAEYGGDQWQYNLLPLRSGRRFRALLASKFHPDEPWKCDIKVDMYGLPIAAEENVYVDLRSAAGLRLLPWACCGAFPPGTLYYRFRNDPQ